MTWKQNRPRRPCKMPYAPGTLFAVPLECGGYAAGVVARVSKPPCGILGYYFGPRLDAPPAIEDAGRLRAPDAIYVSMGSDLHLLNGSWPNVGVIPGWSKSDWPMPCFLRASPLTNKIYRVTYSDDDLWNAVEMVHALPGDLSLPKEGFGGSRYIEIKLTQRLCGEASDKGS